jgi:uncharacterized membrane protein
MKPLKQHLRNAFVTGVFSAIPLVITAVVVWYIEKLTREPLKALFGIDTPFLGILVAVLAIYVLGVVVNSLIGRLLLRWLDSLLSKVPVLKDVYEAWKHITLTPGGKEGIYAKVVLVPGDGEATWMLGFTSGEPVENDPELCCVFVPGTPNPTAGRILFVPRRRCVVIDTTAEAVFKTALSGGNYVPPEVGASAAARRGA